MCNILSAKECISKDKEILRFAIENEKYLGVKTRKKELKVALYNLFICFFNKFRSIELEKVFVVNGKEITKYEPIDDFTTIYYALVSNRVMAYRKLCTHVTCIKLYDRFKAIWRAICLKDKNISFGYALDYLLWKEFLALLSCKEIRVMGHYDRLTTQLAMLSKQNNISFSIKQHGLLGENIVIPHKLHVTEVLAFDTYEKEKFSRNVIKNQTCKYKIFYKTNVQFQETPKQVKRIGIIELPIKEMNEIIRIVSQYYNEGQEILVMLHPLSKNLYSEFSDKKNILFDRYRKEWNLDCIYSGSSTLVYDYIKTGFENPIIVYDGLECFSKVTATYKNIEVFQSLDKFEDKVKELAEI